MSCSGDHHHFTARATACDCGQTASGLAAGGLPYPSWILGETSHFGTRHSNFANATDPRTGRTYEVREYLPDPISDRRAQERRFIAVAKSLRGSVPAPEQVLYAYTRNGRCYTVAEPPQGTPLFQLTPPGRTTEADTVARLAALLAALEQLHSAGAAAGPLFHANLRPETILATRQGTDAPLSLPHSLYLDNILRESPLPPEHFQQADVVAAGDAALTLAQGFGTAADRSARLQRVADTALGATLEYLYGLHGARPGSARSALEYLRLLQRAAATQDRSLFQQARTLSASPRLFRLATAAPAPPPPPPRPQPTSPPPPKPPQPPAQPPPFQAPPYAPVPPTSPPQGQHAPRPGNPPQKPRRRGGCGGCVLTLLLALLVAGAIATIALYHPQSKTTLDFSAEPNPASRKARVELRWTSSGFERVELDGREVDPNGSLFLTATTSHHYTLTGIRPNGSRDRRTVDLTVLTRRATKPAPGTALPPSDSPGDASGDGPREGQTADDTGDSTQVKPSPAELQQVNAALHQWADAMLSNDPGREAANYAPKVDRYFLQSDVSQDFIRRYLTQVRESGTTFTGFSLSNLLTVPESDGSVEARFTKEVTFATPSGPKHQKTHSILHLRQIGDSWKITSERDFRGQASAP